MHWKNYLKKKKHPVIIVRGKVAQYVTDLGIGNNTITTEEK
ncbi:hypothetical protein [Dysgonomonas alginatilytica]|nr:hypothetical protein [Dysgonomonas alginatilytica]